MLTVHGLTRRRFLCGVSAIAAILLTIAAKLHHDQTRPWSAVTESSESLGGGVAFSRVRLSNGSRAFTAVCVAGPASEFRARLSLVRDFDSPQLRNAMLHGETVAINGGYFDTTLRPIGLMRIDQVELAPMESRSPFSGAIVIDPDGHAKIVRNDAGASVAAGSARQCGPLLVEPGVGVSVKPTNAASARSFLAMDDDRLAIVCVSASRLHDVATCLSELPHAFGLRSTDIAINLDGGPSSGLFVRGRCDLPSAGRIADAIFFSVVSSEQPTTAASPDR